MFLLTILIRNASENIFTPEKEKVAMCNIHYSLMTARKVIHITSHIIMKLDIKLFFF